VSWRTLFLLALGLLQMGAAALGLARLQGVALATAASPAPRVFGSARGLETFSSAFQLEWVDRAGAPHVLALTPERYARVAGPYARRNAYGAAVAYGPVLAVDPAARPMLDALLRHALCGAAPLLHELGIDTTTLAAPPRLRVVPHGAVPAELPLVLEARCT
jgi:hypothetical protein